MLKTVEKILAGALIFCLGTVFPVQANEVQPLHLGVTDAIELALEHNLDFRLVLLDWEEARAALERAEIVGEQEMLVQAETDWEKAVKNYQEQKGNLQSLVRSSYQELLECEAAVHNRQIAKERAQSQLAIDKSKYEAGLLSTLDIRRAENSLFSAGHNYEMALIEWETEKMKFSQILGLPFEREVILTERLLLDFLPFTEDLETCYELALAHDGAVDGAREILKTAEEAVTIAQSPFSPRVDLERALANKERAQIGLEKAKQALYFRIRGDYYALIRQAHNLEAREKEIELERQVLLAEESKYAAGVLSNVQIVAQQEKLAQLEQSYSTELLQYSLARLRLLQAIGQGDFWGDYND